MALFSSNITGASRSLRVLARLLSYPDVQLRGDLDDMRHALLSESAIAPMRLAELDSRCLTVVVPPLCTCLSMSMAIRVTGDRP